VENPWTQKGEDKEFPNRSFSISMSFASVCCDGWTLRNRTPWEKRFMLESFKKLVWIDRMGGEKGKHLRAFWSLTLSSETTEKSQRIFE
jgi:hypothetical protein